MAGWVFFLGFALPGAVAASLEKDAPRDASPSPGRCHLCKRTKEDCYRMGDGAPICRDDAFDIVHRSGARRMRAKPRPVLDEWPLERVIEKPRDGFDRWWDRQFV